MRRRRSSGGVVFRPRRVGPYPKKSISTKYTPPLEKGGGSTLHAEVIQGCRKEVLHGIALAV